jgi:4-amino-4-deoxy-L-arabinose transferase-like glycosyltransferase
MTRQLRIEWPTVLFWGTAVVLVLWSLGAKELWGAEDRWAQVVQEMLRTGDWFHPTINGEPYFDKPLLGYWFIAAIAAITGRLDETIVRLPSALAGLLALWATMNLAGRLWGKETARTAGWLLLATNGFLFWARTAEADMENMAAIMLAVAWYWARRDKPGFLSYLVFYLICFTGAQAKGLTAVVVPIVAILPDVLRAGRWKAYLSISHFMALAVGLASYLALPVYADMTRTGYRDSGLWLAFRENVVRYFNAYDHKEKWYVYFGYVPVLLLPWIPLFIAALWRSFLFFKKSDWPAKWLTLSVVFIFLFFTLSGSRRSYYILPIVPFCAILMARFLLIPDDEKWNRLALGIQLWLLVGFVAIEILSPVLWMIVKSLISGSGGLLQRYWPAAEGFREFAPPVGLLIATAVVGLVALMLLVIARLRPGVLARGVAAQPRLVPLIAVAIILLGGLFCVQSSTVARYNTIKPFSLELKKRIGSVPPDNVAFYYKIPNKVLFYLNLPGPTLKPGNVASLKAFLDSQRTTKVLIADSQYRKDLAEAFPGGVIPEPTLKEQVYPWEKESKYEAWIIPSAGM